MTRTFVESIERELRRQKRLGEGTFEQLSEEELCARPDGVQNSIATLVWHISGNLTSRFTDFLTTDGEKPWRDRESEFEGRRVGREELLETWEEGWACLFDALQTLDDDDLDRTVTIRGIALGVGYALHRALGHVSYHMGQIVLLGKAMRGEEWTSLSIPPGKTEAYNRAPDPARERGPSAPEE